MKNEKVCSFFGHRELDIDEKFLVKVEKTIIDLIEKEKITTFLFGGLGMFDDLCYKVVSKLKEKYVNIKRVMCLHDPRHMRESKRLKWMKEEQYENFVHFSLQYDYWRKRIYFRNLEMINISDVVVFFVHETENSGAYKALQYAKKMKKLIINLY